MKKTENNFKQKYDEHKKEYLKDHTTKEMVFENGAALSFILRELQMLNNSVTQLKNMLYGNEEQKN